MFVDLVNPQPLPSFEFLVTDIALSRLEVDLVVVIVVEVGPRKIDVAPEALLGVEEYGPEVDVWATACTAFEVATGQYLFKPKERQRWSKDEDHLLRITELAGHLPRSIIKSGCLGSKFYEGRRMKNVDQRIIEAYSLFQV